MKTFVLLAATLTLLLASGPLWAMEATPAANSGAEMSSCNRMLSHYPPAQAVKVINAMYTEDDVDAGWSASDNSVIVRASLARCQQIEDVLALLDRPESVAPANSTGGDDVTVFHLSHCLAATAAKTVMTALEGKVAAAAAERTNAIVVTAAPRYRPLIEDLLLIVDSPVATVPSVMPAMETTAAPGPEFRQPRRAAQPRMPQPAPAEEELETQVYVLQYGEAGKVASIILDLLHRRNDLTLVPNAAGNQILVSASPDSQQLVRELIAELDIPSGGPSRNLPLLCRVFMLELPPTSVNLKTFLIRLRGTEPAPTETIAAAIQSPNVQIQDISRQYIDPETYELSIVGRAPSREDVTTLIAAFPNAQIQAFSWEEDVAADVRAPQYHASEPLQEHLSRLLGDDLQTVGYWFGDLSLPGEVRAPIGPWTLELTMEPKERDELTFGINVEQTSMRGRGGPGGFTILSNSGRGRVGKPIIIGYNRDRGGARVMGALVIIPEPADQNL